jgi:hypothetical protein
MNHPERLLAEIPALVGDLPSRMHDLPGRVGELPALVSEVPDRIRKATRPRRRPSGMKRVVMLVAVLGAVGAILYVIRSRRSGSTPAPADWRMPEEPADSHGEAREREASATA